MPEQPNQQPEPVPEAERADLFNRFRSLDVMINNDISEVSRGPSSQGPFWSYGGRSFETEEAAQAAWRADIEEHAELSARLSPYPEFAYYFNAYGDSDEEQRERAVSQLEEEWAFARAEVARPLAPLSSGRDRRRVQRPRGREFGSYRSWSRAVK